MRCDGCENWTIRKVTRYENGNDVVNWSASEGKGRCSYLDIETAAEFGCLKFAAGGGDHIQRERKNGAPWDHWTMGRCPDCSNHPGSDGYGSCHRCAGTGKVRYYDDGYVGEEQTKLHPEEKKNREPPKCPRCSGTIDIKWKHCPACGMKLEPVADIEVVDGLGNAGGDYKKAVAK